MIWTEAILYYVWYVILTEVWKDFQMFLVMVFKKILVTLKVTFGATLSKELSFFE